MFAGYAGYAGIVELTELFGRRVPSGRRQPAGIILIFGVNAGLYLLIVPILTALIGGVASAWLFLTREY